MDLFELKVRARDMASRVRTLDWNDPPTRRVIFIIGGIALTVVLLLIAAALALGNAQVVSQARQAAAMNRAEQTTPATTIDYLGVIRDRLMPAVRADDRFSSVLVRPGASQDAPLAVASLQGTVPDRTAFDALFDLVEAHGLIEQIEIVVAIGN